MDELNYVVQYIKINGFSYQHPIRKVLILLWRKQSDSSLTSSNNPNKRENKSTLYQNIYYTILLAAKESYIKKSVLDITDTSHIWYKILLSSEKTVLIKSLFWDDVFEKTYIKIQDSVTSYTLISDYLSLPLLVFYIFIHTFYLFMYLCNILSIFIYIASTSSL